MFIRYHAYLSLLSISMCNLSEVPYRLGSNIVFCRVYSSHLQLWFFFFFFTSSFNKLCIYGPVFLYASCLQQGRVFRCIVGDWFGFNCVFHNNDRILAKLWQEPRTVFLKTEITSTKVYWPVIITTKTIWKSLQISLKSAKTRDSFHEKKWNSW